MWRTQPCTDPANISPMPPRASPASRTSPSPGSNSAAATTEPAAARAGRYAVASRTLHDLGDPRAGRPIDLVVTISRHHCPDCDLFFPADLSDLAWPKCQYTRRVQDLAVRLVAEDGLPYQTAEWHLWRDHRVFVPWATIQNWVEAAGEKKASHPQDDLPRRSAGRLLRLPGHRRVVRRPVLRPVHR